jgi:hypothetical protein
MHKIVSIMRGRKEKGASWGKMGDKGKLRRWLIKKLGGDSIDALAAEPRYVSKYTKVPIRIRSVYTKRIDDPRYETPMERVYSELSSEIANEIVEHHFYTERRETDYGMGVERIEWTVEIIPPERMEEE